MNIIDIVNREIVNLTNCDQEPIHIPGSIQPHGFLFAVNTETLIIDFCSGNIADYLDLQHANVLGKGFSTVFGNDNLNILNQAVQAIGGESSVGFKMLFNGKTFDCAVHQNNTHYIAEAEIHNADSEKLSSVYSQTVQFVSYMNNTNTLKDFCDLVAKGTREVTGYDRVMIYRFDKEYNGEVFAESCRDDLEPFLGLHYTHTDIPVQARELYMKNLLRLIADINYTPVPIYTLDDVPGKNLDLSLSTLRSTSPIHVEYLQNMGVGATLTISLIHRGRLWGLIACHHYSPKNISPEIRMAAQLQGQFITSQIDVRQLNEEYEVSRKTNIALEKLTAIHLPPIAESFKIISLSPELLRLCNAAGVSVLINGKIYKNGLSPRDEDVKSLSAWLSAYSNDTTFYTDKIVSFVPDLKLLCDTVAGIIYHSLGNGNSIIWYRPETLVEVNWAGDPNKAIIKDSQGLHPRNSFSQWKQIIKCRSNNWLQPELNTAANYAHALQKQISMLILSEEEEKYRSLSEVLKETNSELENINWISTHDLQEPLRKIQLISSRLLSIEDEALSESIADSLQRMNNSANRMQTLLKDILKYTRIQYTDEAFEPVDLNVIFDEVMIDIREVLKEQSAEVDCDNLPVIQGIPFLLKQLFSNIILNSLKYASPERMPKIHISATVKPENSHTQNTFCNVITFSDNGIGFDQQYAESIFNIFTRLHGHGEYKGSGVGLALCKKIMKTHNGTISAIGQKNAGATFSLYFPCETNGPHSL